MCLLLSLLAFDTANCLAGEDGSSSKLSSQAVGALATGQASDVAESTVSIDEGRCEFSGHVLDQKGR